MNNHTFDFFLIISSGEVIFVAGLNLVLGCPHTPKHRKQQAGHRSAGVKSGPAEAKCAGKHLDNKSKHVNIQREE